MSEKYGLLEDIFFTLILLFYKGQFSVFPFVLFSLFPSILLCSTLFCSALRPDKLNG